MKRSRDLGLDHVKRALSNNENPLSKPKLEFVRMSCHILGINGEDTIKSIMRRAKEKGENQPKRVMASLRDQLAELGARAEDHKRPTLTRPSPRGCTTAWVRLRAAWRTCSTVRRTEGSRGWGVLQGN